MRAPATTATLRRLWGIGGAPSCYGAADDTPRSAAGNHHAELLARHVLAGEQLLGLRALFLEYHGSESLQVAAGFLDRLALRVHAGQLLHETDVAMLVFQEYGGEGNLGLFHRALRLFWHERG